MSYTVSGLIEAADYNGLVNDNANNVNTIWSTGTTDKGYGQTAIANVATVGATVTATQWAALVNTVTSIGSHQGTTITARTAPVAGNVIAILSNLVTDIDTLTGSRGNAVASGTAIGTFTGSVTAGNVTINDSLITFGTTSNEYADSGRIAFKDNVGTEVAQLRTNFLGYTLLSSINGGISGVASFDGAAIKGHVYAYNDGVIMKNTASDSSPWRYLSVDSSDGITASGSFRYTNNELGMYRSYTGTSSTTLSKNYVRLPKSGNDTHQPLMQWGYQTGSVTNVAVTFPVAFPTACRSVSVTVNRSTRSGDGANYATSVTASGFTAVTDSPNDFWWIAFGD